MSPPVRLSSFSWIQMPASIAVIIAGVYLAKGVLVPCTLAILLSFLLSPVCDWLERWRLGRIPAVLVTATVGFGILGALIWTAALQVSYLAPKIPEYRDNVEAKLKSVNEYALAELSKLTTTGRKVEEDLAPVDEASEPRGTEKFPFSVRVVTSPTSPLEIFGGMFGTLLEVLGTIGVVIVFVIFFLIGREELRDRFIRLAGRGQVTVTTQMLEDASARVSRYLLVFSLLNVTFGISIGIGLFLIGIPNAILWGILAAALRFIPYLGPWIAASMPIVLSMAISPGWGPIILTVLLFVAIELLNNNLLEPWLYGTNTGVSAVAVIVAAVFWTWLWGPMGLLLATPLTVCVLVVGKHVPQLAFLNVLLGTEPVFEPKKQVYQRLLAGDVEQAAELFSDSLQDKSLVDVYDSVLIPALAMGEMHWHLGELNDVKHTFIVQSLKEMIQDDSDRRHEKLAKEAISPTPDSAEVSAGTEIVPKLRVRILCLPARTEADEITGMMLAQVLEAAEFDVQAVSVTSLANEIVDIVGPKTADVMCVSATPPAAVMHAGYLCRRLSARFPGVKLVVGLWGTTGEMTRARDRIGGGAIVVATLADAQKEISRLTAPHASVPTQHEPVQSSSSINSASTGTGPGSSD